MLALSQNDSSLSPCQQAALGLWEKSADNLFLSGRAGTGKSHLIRRFLQDMDAKTFPILASTGVAAILVGGRTFHSFFGLGIMEKGRDAAVAKAIEDRKVALRLRRANGFVLDEVSMISGEALSAAEEVARLIRKSQLPWGGLRVVAVGDFGQLPPVPKNGVRDWAFADPIWEKSAFEACVLKTNWRTDDDDFLQVLEDVRDGRTTERVRDYLNSRLADLETIDENHATCLLPLREKVEHVNKLRLAALDGTPVSYQTEYAGHAASIAALRKIAPVPDELVLKLGCRVMIRINDPAQRFVNGSVGSVVTSSDTELSVQLRNGRVVELEKHRFTLLDAEGNERASAKNFPVSLAYAITIHKSQGLTLDEAVVDLGKLWEPGQAYVALSRLRTGEGLSLLGWNESSIRADAEVKRFYETLADPSKPRKTELPLRKDTSSKELFFS